MLEAGWESSKEKLWKISSRLFWTKAPLWPVNKKAWAAARLYEGYAGTWAGQGGGVFFCCRVWRTGILAVGLLRFHQLRWSGGGGVAVAKMQTVKHWLQSLTRYRSHQLRRGGEARGEGDINQTFQRTIPPYRTNTNQMSSFTSPMQLTTGEWGEDANQKFPQISTTTKGATEALCAGVSPQEAA